MATEQSGKYPFSLNVKHVSSTEGQPDMWYLAHHRIHRYWNEMMNMDASEPNSNISQGIFIAEL